MLHTDIILTNRKLLGSLGFIENNDYYNNESHPVGVIFTNRNRDRQWDWNAPSACSTFSVVTTVTLPCPFRLRLTAVWFYPWWPSYGVDEFNEPRCGRRPVLIRRITMEDTRLVETRLQERRLLRVKSSTNFTDVRRSKPNRSSETSQPARSVLLNRFINLSLIIALLLRLIISRHVTRARASFCPKRGT